MNQYNKYGFVSGGAIFDAMDRAALRMLNSHYPETDNENWFTASAETSFLRQACPGTKITCVGVLCDKNDDTAYIAMGAYADGTQVATSAFVFKKARHDFCKIQGGNNESNTEQPVG